MLNKVQGIALISVALSLAVSHLRVCRRGLKNLTYMSTVLLFPLQSRKVVNKTVANYTGGTTAASDWS